LKTVKSTVTGYQKRQNAHLL